jgi:hypothetical protein
MDENKYFPCTLGTPGTLPTKISLKVAVRTSDCQNKKNKIKNKFKK